MAHLATRYSETTKIVILSFIKRLSSLQGLKLTCKIKKGPQSLSFTERFFPLCSECTLLEVPQYSHQLLSNDILLHYS